jgi:Short C-terminal domain
MKRRTAPGLMTRIAVAAMVVAGVGFVVMLILNAFWFDEYDAYGEVSIPGKTSLQLPAGDVTVTFNTVLIGSSGNGLPVPKLGYTITGPKGVGELTISEDYGTSTTVNNDARRRIGYLHVVEAGTYDIDVDGNVSAYLNPTLTFGHGSNYGRVPWILAAVFGVGLVDLIVARVWASRLRRRESGPGYSPPPMGLGATPTWAAAGYPPPPPPPPQRYDQPGSFTPSDEGIRVQQLNSLARLRDSGALTEDEFQAEKKRLLSGS